MKLTNKQADVLVVTIAEKVFTHLLELRKEILSQDEAKRFEQDFVSQDQTYAALTELASLNVQQEELLAALSYTHAGITPDLAEDAAEEWLEMNVVDHLKLAPLVDPEYLIDLAEKEMYLTIHEDDNLNDAFKRISADLCVRLSAVDILKHAVERQ